MPSEILNKDCFSLPKLEKHYQAASGVTGNGQNGGMSAIQRIHLSPGQNYYRFCDSSRYAQDPKSAAAGGWWTDYEVFCKVRNAAASSATMKAYAAKHGQSALSYAAKLYFAIPYEWGDCGTIVVARLQARIDAFKGRGLIAYLDGNDLRDGGAKYIPMQDPSISQLFIPELRSHFDKAFKIVKSGPASAFM